MIKRTNAILIGIALALVAPYASALAGGARPIPANATSKITSGRSKEHIDLLASDAMMGRNTPSPQLDSAASYIAGKFREYGLEPVNGSYFHEYFLKRDKLGAGNWLRIGAKSFQLKNDFAPYPFSGSGTGGGRGVFVGYGISRPGDGYDDYQGVDVRGKIVLVIAGEPKPFQAKDAGIRIPADVQPRGKMLEAARHGAAGFLLMTNPAQYKIIQPSVYWASFYKNSGNIPQPFELESFTDGPQPIPAMNIGGEAAREIFGGTIEQIAALVRRIDSTGRPASMELKTSVAMQIEIERERLPVHNVIGMIRGSSLPDEYVIIGAHYDHIGHSAKGHADHPQDSIFNGADDNASGTTGLLLNAEAFGALSPGNRPARSIIFLAFSGEEKGLWGSRAYAAHPAIPNSRLVAMINMDMIGRNGPDSVEIAGRSRSPQLAAMVDEANHIEPMFVSDSLEEMFYRSDQASFADKKIPVVFFSTGEHPDYHKVTDSPDKIDNEKLAHVARLCFRTAWIAADSPDHPAFQEVKVTDPNALLLDD